MSGVFISHRNDLAALGAGGTVERLGGWCSPPGGLDLMVAAGK